MSLILNPVERPSSPFVGFNDNDDEDGDVYHLYNQKMSSSHHHDNEGQHSSRDSSFCEAGSTNLLQQQGMLATTSRHIHRPRSFQ
jgi:hypothetical protein